MALDKLAALHQTVVTPEYAAPLERALLFAILLIALDIFLARGPPRRLILKLFRSPDQDGSKEAQRLQGQVAARVVGGIFLFMMFPRAFAALLDPKLAADPIYATSPESVTVIVLAAGYFLYDIFICSMRYEENGPAFLLHAVMCCGAFVNAIISHRLHHIGAGFLMWELSTPFLYLRWVFLKAGLGNSKIMAPVNFAFILVFFGCRVVYGPILSKQFIVASARELASPRVGGMTAAAIYAHYVAMAVLNCLNYWWFYQMMRLALKGDSRTKKKTELPDKED